MSWNKLEIRVKNLLKSDGARTVPGSGNGKSEEDVIGISTISQCKYTENKNTSILAKDVQRLVSAANLQEKLPLFFTESDGSFILSIPDNPLMSTIVKMIVAIALLDKLHKEAKDCQSVAQYNRLRRFVENQLKRVMDDVKTSTSMKYQLIRQKLDTKYDDLTQYDLFEDLH